MGMSPWMSSDSCPVVQSVSGLGHRRTCEGQSTLMWGLGTRDITPAAGAPLFLPHRLPQSQTEWAQLLESQQKYHDTELQKWREIIKSSVMLLDQVRGPYLPSLPWASRHRPSSLRSERSTVSLHQTSSSILSSPGQQWFSF